MAEEPPSRHGGGLEFAQRSTGLAGLIFLPANFSAMMPPGRFHPMSEAGTGRGSHRKAASRRISWQKDFSAENGRFQTRILRQPGFAIGLE
jgi:hypothetical protein